MKKTIALIALLSSALSFSAIADKNMPTMNHNSIESHLSSMQQELDQSMMRMHQEMAKSTSIEDPDIAFAKGMIAHHLGAIDMAKIELKYGKNAEMRKLAQEIIDAQGPEIKQMQQWLDKHPSTKKE
ncbi:DUF305 domain-containing protein [Moellerella wisconsensis]|uniref:DUF305 domain-containing protein n=2 Tax=Moellerella wisconsensis TaxID=158849 RepID=A0ACD3Y4R0_9GAMM|nr:DUF305 domain-containing protein [Moellerella wisconsensis]UNH29547.1 DUF305 domain-containing protein [Moellerella wisconsensis]UNH37686.1 DUF305 domain-containing protein [Moellerella wisconsensis]UNH41238.1 DUF305 domain-containing protein [Moellerella wisconsensis]